MKPFSSVFELALSLGVALTMTAALPAQQKGAPAAPPKSKVPRGPDTEQAERSRIAGVNPNRRGEAELVAQKLDQLVEQNLASHQLRPNALASDEQFVRRAYLDITGTIPTPIEIVNFLNAQRADKRQVLIDYLLDSPGFVSHTFNDWSNLLRLVDRPSNQITAIPFHEWIKDAIRQNMPHDKMVYQMLTAKGHLWTDPATGYLLRDQNMPLDATNNTVRVFLGTQIGCAQCHDHPFDVWTQKQFYEMAAYTYGMVSRTDSRVMGGNPIKRLRDELAKVDPKHRGGGSFLRVIQANMAEIRDTPRSLRLPHDYHYSDAKPNDVVRASFLFGEPPRAARQTSPREQFALWLTSPENPRFAKSTVNRLWHRAMGAGILEPIDDIREEDVPENPELLKVLTEEFVRLKFDVKEMLRTIYYTQTYQRQPGVRRDESAQSYHFPGPVLRRLTAEQIWDSLLTMAVYHPGGFRRLPFKDYSQLQLDLKTCTVQQTLAIAKLYDEKFSPQALSKADRLHSYKGMTLARASELPLPLPANHFLRQFGQSDRELIQADHTDGSVTQILTMFNGPITHMMLEEGSVIYDNVVAQKTLRDRIDMIFLSVLSRMPTSEDYAIARAEISANGPAGYGNVIWALINTKEFLFIQ